MLAITHNEGGVGERGVVITAKGSANKNSLRNTALYGQKMTNNSVIVFGT